MYNIGDEVYIKSYSTLRRESIVGEWEFSIPLMAKDGLLIKEDMLESLGKKAIVNDVIRIGCNTRYLLDVSGDYFWSECVLTNEKQTDDGFSYLIGEYTETEMAIRETMQMYNIGDDSFRNLYDTLSETLRALEVLIKNLK